MLRAQNSGSLLRSVASSRPCLTIQLAAFWHGSIQERSTAISFSRPPSHIQGISCSLATVFYAASTSCLCGCCMDDVVKWCLEPREGPAAVARARPPVASASWPCRGPRVRRARTWFGTNRAVPWKYHVFFLRSFFFRYRC